MPLPGLLAELPGLLAELPGLLAELLRELLTRLLTELLSGMTGSVPRIVSGRLRLSPPSDRLLPSSTDDS